MGRAQLVGSLSVPQGWANAATINPGQAAVPATGVTGLTDAASAAMAKLEEIDTELANALAGGGPKYVERHHARGKLTARERIELLVDQDSPFLELSPLAAWGSSFKVGASTVTG
ncbi:PE/PPE C-terminal domain-containing protein, partial [Mycobacterium avium]|uniref:PE/PPE C-terminal domain-containing protein n=1 Tax=Mycobacterium avium TaxID=1764 RepID=UPI002F26CC0C